MQYKNKLNTTLLSCLLGLSGLTGAAQNQDSTQVDVNIENGDGKVIIVKHADGKNKTIKESFTVGADTDVDALVQGLLNKHGIDPGENPELHKVTEFIGPHSKNMVWVQKNDDVNVNLDNGQATIVIKKDHNGEVEVIEQTIEVDADTDIDALVDALMVEHGIEAGDAALHRKIIKLDKHTSQIEDNKPRLGFMANVKDNGWEIISVVPDSGAAEAGLKKGDVVISIDGQSTAKGGLGLTEFIAIDKQAGDISEVLVMRDEQELALNVAVKVLDSPDIIMELSNGKQWFTSSGKDFKFSQGDLDGMFEGLHVDVEHLDKIIEDFGDREIHVVTSGDADAYFFAGSKMNQWLGRNHHFSTITEALGKYFGTTQGVLVLEVDQNNKLGLQDGDVIQAINGEDVNTPKDVVRIMSGFKSDESFDIEIIREKETMYLES